MPVNRKKRNETEVSVDILRHLTSPKIVTDISSHANASHRAIVLQINSLGKMGLVDIRPNPDKKSSNPNSAVLQITEKGRKFLEVYQSQKEALDTFYGQSDPDFDYMRKVNEIKRTLRKS